MIHAFSFPPPLLLLPLLLSFLRPRTRWMASRPPSTGSALLCSALRLSTAEGRLCRQQSGAARLPDLLLGLFVLCRVVYAVQG